MALPASETRCLLSYVSGLTREQLITRPVKLTDEQQQHYDELLARRAAGVPIAYLIGQREFYGRDFFVSTAVLIPRPETECLVDFVLLRAPHGAQVLDLGTGSGAIAVSLAAERPDLHITAVDISTEALAVAGRNNTAWADGRVQLLHGDWFVPVTHLKFDFIISNPPYIAAGDPHLQQGDLRYEPACALTDGADGLNAARHLAHHAQHYLRPGGWLALEHGYDQASAVRSLLQATGWHNVQSARDLANIERITYGLSP